jgi:hypothetical protein
MDFGPQTSDLRRNREFNEAVEIRGLRSEVWSPKSAFIHL